jgi:hypothetical protein
MLHSGLTDLRQTWHCRGQNRDTALLLPEKILTKKPPPVHLDAFFSIFFALWESSNPSHLSD